MNKLFFILTCLFAGCLCSFGQTSNEKIMYIVDSIPVINDPEQGNDIQEKDVAEVIVIRNKDSLKQMGYQQFDGVLCIFTKAYRNRPDSIRRIPSSKQMAPAEDKWTFRNTPYTGPFIDYYYSGKKQREGRMLNGKLTGRHTFFYQNGNIAVEREYEEGNPHGWEKEYYSNGSLRQAGRYVQGKEEGVWETYFPNGSVKLRSNYRGGTLEDSAAQFYSNGRVKERVLIKNGKAIADQAHIKIGQLMAKSRENDQAGDRKAAIKYCTKVIELDSTYADAYFSRGTLKLNDFQFDEAIADFDKALTIEPFMEVALSNRAFARIRKYQFGNSRELSKNSEVDVRASRDKVSIPPEDQVKICNDLQAAISLDDRSKMILEAVKQYCH